MKKLLNPKILSITAAILTFISAMNVTSASAGDYYQPRVPKCLK